MDQYSHPAIEDLLKVEDNQKCFDCGNLNPKWASLNNAIYVCLKCAGLHRSFGVNVSFIRSLTIDSWDENHIELLRRGGNKRFRDFLDEFRVPDNAEMDFKYMIRASDYYRKLLKCEVNGIEPPYKPDIISGLEMLDYGVNPNFSIDNSRPITSNYNQTNKEQKNSGGFMQSVGSFWSKAKVEMKKTADKVGSKIKEMELGDKIKHTGEKTLVFAKVAGNLVVEKSKEAYHSELVQNLTHKTEEGINVIVEKAKKILKKDQHLQNDDRLHFDEIPSHSKSNYHSEPLSNYNRVELDKVMPDIKDESTIPTMPAPHQNQSMQKHDLDNPPKI